MSSPLASSAGPTSPASLTASAALALTASAIPALRRLQVHETEQAVVIAGQLPSYYLKQMAQEAIMPLLAGRLLHNRVRVVREVASQLVGAEN